MVKVDQPLYTRTFTPSTDVETKIGQIIAEKLIENGATLQMGKGMDCVEKQQ
jgi:hypothetical protein